MKKELTTIISSTSLLFFLNGCATTSDYTPKTNHSPQRIEQAQKYEPLIYLGCFIYLLTL